jgi:hypothetical protein
MGWVVGVVRNFQYVRYDTPEGQATKVDGQFWTSDKTTIVPIRFASEGQGSKEICPPTTLPEVFKRCVEEKGDKVVLRIERGT